MIVSCVCGKKLRIADNLAGRKIRCPACGEVSIAVDDSTPSLAELEEPNIVPDSEEDREDLPRPQHSTRKKNRAAEDEPQTTPPPTLLLLSGILGTLAVVGFIASGVMIYLGGKARAEQESKPQLLTRAEPKQPAIANITASPAPKDVNPQPPVQQNLPLQKAKDPLPKGVTPTPPQPPVTGPKKADPDELYRLDNIYSQSLSFSADGRSFVFTNGLGLAVFDLRQGKIRQKFDLDQMGSYNVNCLPGGSQALLGRSLGGIDVVDWEQGKILRSFEPKVMRAMFLKLRR